VIKSEENNMMDDALLQLGEDPLAELNKTGLKLERKYSSQSDFNLMKYDKPSYLGFENNNFGFTPTVKKELSETEEGIPVNIIAGQRDHENDLKVPFSPGFFTPTYYIESPRIFNNCTEEEFY